MLKRHEPVLFHRWNTIDHDDDDDDDDDDDGSGDGDIDDEDDNDEDGMAIQAPPGFDSSVQGGL